MVLGLLTAAAFCHAGWNLLMKTSGEQGPQFVWLCAAIAAPLSVVVLVWYFVRGELGVTWQAALVSMLLHTAYSVVLQWAYKTGDFSGVYSVSRGATPVIVTLAAIPWIGGPSLQVWCGVAAVLFGVLVMDRVAPGRGSLKGLAVAACSAGYTLWDGYAIASLGAQTLPYLAVTNVGQLAVLTLVLAPRRRLTRAVFASWRRAIPIALLTPASYGLVLVAMSLSPVSTVAVGRTLNVAIGNLLGLAVLRERLTRTAVVGLTAVVAGVLLVSIGA
ncbi:EamA family transporter [Kribbella sp. NPDC056861]|uniref:EamA family transporter n=1 Tax=Kribbella sp. NPDC056861 TaxID=3154857 RepID=UPI0034372C9C